MALPSPEMFEQWQGWAASLIEILEGKITTGDNPIVTMPAYSKTRLPKSDRAGLFLFVTDEVDRPAAAYSDGTNWLRVSDRSVVGTLYVAVVSNADYSLNVSDTVVLMSGATVARTCTLPASASAVGKAYYVKRVSSTANVIIAVQTDEDLDGVTDGTEVLTSDGLSLTLIPDGSGGWWTI